MKFSEVYRNEMDNVTVSEAAITRVNEYNNNYVGWKKNIRTNIIRTVLATTCSVMLLMAVYYNRDAIRVLGQSIFGSYIFDISGNRIEIGDIEPIKFNTDLFVTCEGVNVDVNEDNVKAYWKNYDCLDEIEKETGIKVITSNLLEKSLREGCLTVIIWNGYGHFNGDFVYGEYTVNMDGMFTCEGYKQDEYGYGYGTSEDDNYEFSYEASNGIKVYFISHQYGNKLIFQAGNILYQVNSDAPVEELKKLIETFEF